MADRNESPSAIAPGQTRKPKKIKASSSEGSLSATGDLVSAIHELIKGLKADEHGSPLVVPTHRQVQPFSKTARFLAGHGTNKPALFPQRSVTLGSDSIIADEYNLEYLYYDCNYDRLEQYRSDVASLARFSQRVEHATFHLIVIVDAASDHKVGRFVDRLLEPVRTPPRRTSDDWYGGLASLCFSRWETARDMLELNLPLPAESEQLYRTAFWSLCELTPADSQLKLLFEKDRSKASRELVRHVDAYANQLALAADLARTMADEDRKAEHYDDGERLATIQEALLDKSGGRLTLTEAAGLLGITRQALHKKIRSGSALGLMKGDTFVVPGVQLVQADGRTSVVGGLRDVLEQFGQAGNWSALQFLIEPDPALGGALPIDVLKNGGTDAVVGAARGYLGLDEG